MWSESRRCRYSTYLDSGELSKIRAIKGLILNDLNEEITSKKISASNLDVIYWQKLYTLVFNSKLNKDLFKMTLKEKKIGLAIPTHWIKTFALHYAVSKRRSQIKFFLVILKHILKNLVHSFYYLTPTFTKKNIKILKNFKSEGFLIVFLNRNMNDIYLLDFGDPNLKCFTNWYKKFTGTSKIAFIHQIKQAKKKYCLEYLYMDKFPLSFQNYLMFLLKSIKIYIFAFLELGVGNYKHIYCISEIIQDLRTKMTPTYAIPNVIIFNESNSIVRPLFSYTMEDRGVSVQNFSFSVSANPNLMNETVDNSPWPLNSWPSIFTFDEYHSEFLSKFKNLGKVKLQEIHEIPFYTDKNITFNFYENKYIALFDILPQSNYFGASTLNDIGTNDWNTWYKLMDLSIKITNELGIKLIYKPKKSLSKSMNTFLNRYSSLIILDQKVSPHRVIEGSTLVITSAITTPLFIGNFYKIPTVVFCPSYKLLRSDPVLRKSHIARNEAELRDFILRVI